MRHGRDIEWLRCPQGHEWEVEVETSGDGWHEPRTWELLCDRDGRCAECGAEWLGWDDWSEPEEPEEEATEEDAGADDLCEFEEPVDVLELERYRTRAREQWGSEGEIEIDKGAMVSISEDQDGKAGAYVAAWVYVSKEEEAEGARP